jgi:hypothetical protein
MPGRYNQRCRIAFEVLRSSRRLRHGQAPPRSELGSDHQGIGILGTDIGVVAVGNISSTSVASSMPTGSYARILAPMSRRAATCAIDGASRMSSVLGLNVSPAWRQSGWNSYQEPA